MVVLDTNIVIDYLIGKENVVKAVNQYLSEELAITFVNQYELLKYSNRKTIEKSIEELRVYQSSKVAMNEAAKSYKLIYAKSRPISDNDLIIYGVCVTNGEILLTQDEDFLNLEGKLIKIIK